MVGLGNPGLVYKKTRHNLGFMVVDALLKDFDTRLKSDTKSSSLKAKISFKKKDFILAKPLTYMNVSGEAVLKLTQIHKIKQEDILVICDDINLDVGRIKIKAQGSSGGHKGLESIIKALGAENFARLRIGIVSFGRKQKEIKEYVLSKFLSSEENAISTAIELSKEAVLSWLEYGVEKTMSRFNQTNPFLEEN